MATITNATLKLWIYAGLFGQKDPANPTYTLFKEKLPSESGITFDIAELVKDYIEVRFTGDYTNIQQSAWVQYEVERNFDDSTSETLIGDFIAYNGWGNFEEGTNPTLDPLVLMTNRTIYVPEGEIAHIPVSRTTNGVSSVEYFVGGVSQSTEAIGFITTKIGADLTTYTADTTLLTADVTYIKSATSEATSIVSTTDADEITFTGVDYTTDVVYCVYKCSGKYTPYKVVFLNRYGVLQDLWFFAKRTDNLGVTKDEYKRNTIDVGANDVTYSRYDSTKEIYNVTSNRTFSLNTDFVAEEYNEVIRELLMTENAWIVENGQPYPVVPKSSDLTYKTVLNDKLINFEVQFEYAYNDINNIH